MFKRNKDKDKDKEKKKVVSRDRKGSIAPPSNSVTHDESRIKSPTPSQSSGSKTGKRQAPAPPDRKINSKVGLPGSGTGVNKKERDTSPSGRAIEGSIRNEEMDRKDEKNPSKPGKVALDGEESATPPPTRNMPIPHTGQEVDHRDTKVQHEGSVATNSLAAPTRTGSTKTNTKTPPKMIAPYNVSAKRRASNVTKDDSKDIQVKDTTHTGSEQDCGPPVDKAYLPKRPTNTVACKFASRLKKVDSYIHPKLLSLYAI
ncbi:hypothetical protein SARC_06483 [Sphaeroforma arctica JP610]|uniref:Uncharacterized protein n=1 Tax=Sphaeroforma arctica JP610 TaxID=667725 RepID=A0A0L0FWI1_9EUKA|nr:hypothetical protein SARC_06483 [Sphaeroforma arctica JP610]KNC81172.1 hypothetical protein SARC_06483 [Sphaeroforma arctica JP610]|eukprot:XP_014155074.1 hypothetical protein SARC_06483 [Sphaeroforma arctica JP610]